MATASNVFYYLNIIRDCYLRRRLIEAGSRIVTESFDLRHETVDGLADEADKLIFDITQRRVSMEVISMQQLVQQAMEAVELAHDNKGLLTGLPTGFRELDKLTNGFHEGEMIVVAARPSKGKTALAMNIAEHIGILHGKPVGIFSLEMTSKELGLRMLSSVSKVDSRKMRDGFTNERDHLALTDAASRMRKAPIYIDDTGALTISQLRAKARRMVKQYKIKMIVIDYLQLMHGVTRRQESRAQEVSEISGGIKALAKELKVPILVISQLNRDVEKRPDSKPRLADLRESGAIEQDADVVLLLARGGADEEDEGEQGKSDLVIAKQRNGPTGNVELTFLAHCTRFVDRAKTQD
jgi:replicative DNA helicase